MGEQNHEHTPHGSAIDDPPIDDNPSRSDYRELHDSPVSVSLTGPW